MIVIELTAVTEADGSTTTFYFADERFTTEPTDTPANTAFSEALLDPGTLSQTAFGDGKTGGGTELAYGEVVLANGDGRWDHWLVGHGFDGQPVTIRQGPRGGRFPDDYPPIFAAACKSLRVDETQVIVSLRDRALIFAKPVLTTLYAGTNDEGSPAFGFEGTGEDIKGQPKPRILGGPVREIEPVCVDPGKQIYQLNNGALAEIGDICDGGLAFTFGVNRATKEDLQANDPASGFYDTCLAEGFIRLGSTPTSQLTCAAATQGASLADRTAAAIIRTLALEAGVAPADIDEAAFDALAAANPAALGLWLDDATTTFAEVMDLFADTVGAWWGFAPDGTLRVGRLEAPAAESAAEADFEIPARRVIGSPVRRPALDGDVPVWRVTVRWGRLYTVQTNGVLPAVDEEHRAYLGEEWRRAVDEDADVLTMHTLAPAEVYDSLFTSEADAQAEATRLLALHKVHRDFYDITLPAEDLAPNAVRIGDEAWATYPRFTLADGAALVVLGIRPLFKTSVAPLTLWG